MTPSENGATVQHPSSIEEEALGICRELATSPRILDRFDEACTVAGLVGESRAAKLVYLATTSRLFERPISVAIKGPSAAGKSYVVERVLSFFPSSAFYALTAMSEKALVYLKESLVHRMLVIYEASGVSNDQANTLLRCLLSEGHIRHITVDDKREGKVIDKEGPTGLLVTTTEIALHPENETRLLSVPVTDTVEQTEAIMLALADENPREIDLSAWVALQVWLAEGECDVTIPFATELAKKMSGVAVRLRRDFGVVLALIRAHALLHRASREVDERGRIVATIDDYSVVRALVEGLISDQIGKTVKPTTRETVEAVVELQAQHENGVPYAPVCKKLKLDKSTVSRRVRDAIVQGYLQNLEDRDGRAARVVKGDALPDDAEILPIEQEIGNRCTVAVDSEGPRANGFDPDAEAERVRKSPDLRAPTGCGKCGGTIGYEDDDGAKCLSCGRVAA